MCFVFSMSQVVKSSRVEACFDGNHTCWCGMAPVFRGNFEGFRLKHLSGAKLWFAQDSTRSDEGGPFICQIICCAQNGCKKTAHELWKSQKIPNLLGTGPTFARGTRTQNGRTHFQYHVGHPVVLLWQKNGSHDIWLEDEVLFVFPSGTHVDHVVHLEASDEGSHTTQVDQSSDCSCRVANIRWAVFSWKGRWTNSIPNGENP